MNPEYESLTPDHSPNGSSSLDFSSGQSPEPSFPEFQKTARRHFSHLGLMYFLGTLIIFAVQIGINFLAVRLPFLKINSMDTALLLSSLPMYLISMPLMALLIQSVPAVPVARHKMSFLQWIASFFMCYTMMYLSNLIGLFLSQIISLLKGTPVENPLSDIVVSIHPLTAFFIMVLCAPVAEELLFRKLLIERTAKYGEKTAILFSAFFFGLFHGNLNQFAYAFTLGAFFGFIYVKTGKLIYTVCLHMAVNFFGSVVSIFLLNSTVFQELSAFSGDPAALMTALSGHLAEFILIGLYSFMILGFLITGIICLAVNAKKMKLKPAAVPLPKGKLFSAAFFNIGVLLFTVFWVIQIILQLLA